jgi:putative sigma-54 modulation protein
MNVKLNEKKCTIQPSVKDYAEKKVAKLDRYFKGDAQATVTFRVQKKDCRVELTVHSGSTWFRAEETTTDMMASIDAAINSIEGQIRKNKTRLAKRLRTDAFVREVEESSTKVPDVVEESQFDVIRSKKFPIKPMSVDEAILQMNLLGHSFFAFRDEGSGGAFAVVYIRLDGGYGLIEDDAE